MQMVIFGYFMALVYFFASDKTAYLPQQRLEASNDPSGHCSFHSDSSSAGVCSIPNIRQILLSTISPVVFIAITWIMSIWKIVVVLVIIVAATYAVPRLGKSRVIEQNGNQLSIEIGKHRLTAFPISNEITDSFLVIGGSPEGDMYFTTLISVIPFNTAERL